MKLALTDKTPIVELNKLEIGRNYYDDGEYTWDAITLVQGVKEQKLKHLIYH